MEVLAGGGPTVQRYSRSGPGVPEAAGGASRPRADGQGSALAQFDHAAPAPLLARAPSMTAVSFDGRFGWLHLPDPAVGVRAGFVLCPPLGREAHSAHRPLVHFADMLAARGLAVLRYDHLGAGDSLDVPEGGDVWSEWRAGIPLAAAFLRANTPARTLIVGGLGLGASLAALEWRRARAGALMLLAPVTKGRTWIRELRLTANILRGGSQGEAEVLEAAGLVLSPDLVTRVQSLDLNELTELPEAVFLAEASPGAKLADRLRSHGARVQATMFEDYERLMRDAFANAFPQALFERATDWAEGLVRRSGTSPRACVPPPSTALRGPGWQERPVEFGAGLRGVLCTPEGLASRRAVVLANTGGDPRPGVGRFAVQASRALARRGVGALRFDFAGIGDSAFQGAWRSHVYLTPRAEDFAAAIELLDRNGYDEPLLAGVCSGAYHALHAALADERIAGVFAVNPGDWIWREASPLVEAKRERIVSSRALLRGAVQDILASPKAPLGPNDSLTPVVSELARRFRRRWSHGPLAAETRQLRSRLRRLSRRGARVSVIVGRSDVSLDELEVRFGWRGGWLGRQPGFRVQITRGLDHGLAIETSRSLVLNDLLAFSTA